MDVKKTIAIGLFIGIPLLIVDHLMSKLQSFSPSRHKPKRLPPAPRLG